MGRMLAILTAAAALWFAAPRADAQEGEWNDAAVDAAIAKARQFLWSQWADGHWPEQGKPGAKEGTGYAVNYGGATALCLYALLSAGEDRQGERVKQTLYWLSKADTNGTYARSLRACAYAMLGRNSPYQKQLADDVNWLVIAADERGAYSYLPAPREAGGALKKSDAFQYDNSNSQLAVLGVWAGARNGVPVPPDYWKRVEKHWLADQRADGGWTYQSAGPRSYGSMSAAGLATLFVCFDALYAKDHVACKPADEYAPIARGLEWLDKNFDTSENPKRGQSQYYYYLYGLARVGVSGGYKYLGGKDWYKQAAQALLDRQGANGSWGDLVDTGFGLLFLARGQQPVLLNKLRYDGTWNCRPRDAANLAAWISDAFERPVQWQVLDVGQPVAQWQDAPILYISGATAPKFSEAELARLREFALRGGTIFSEAAGSRPAFTLAMQKCYAGMFPEYPLTRLDDKHPIYSAYFKVGGAKGLSGVSNGVRLLAMHSPSEVSLAWETNDTAGGIDQFQLAANVYFFVTDKGSLRQRGVSGWPAGPAVAPTRTVKVAIVKHAGNWNPEPLAWQRFGLLMAGRHGIGVELSPPTDPAELDATQWPAAAMTGAGALELTDAQRRGLVKFISAGGTLIVDAAGGDADFAASAQKLLGELLPDEAFDRLPADHDIYLRCGPAIAGVSLRRAVPAMVVEARRPRVRALTRNGRVAVLFSAEDLTAGLVGYPCLGLAGYQPQSAFELMRNFVLYANGKTWPAPSTGPAPASRAAAPR